MRRNVWLETPISQVTNKISRVVLIMVGGLLIALTVTRAVTSWKNDSHIEHVSAVWVALALDVENGVFYRAPFGPHGYGGTRFFPLYFCLHAAGIKLFHSWRTSGYLLSAASVLLLLTGMFRLLRRLGAGIWLASAAVLALLAGASVQDSLLTIREDGTATMLNVWAVALCIREEFSWKHLFGAAILFTAAFATKETSIFGVAAVVLWLLARGDFRSGRRLLGLTAIGYVLVLGAMFFASNGRAFEVLRLTAATGVSFRNLLQSPATLVATMNGYVAETVLLVLAVGASLFMWTQKRLQLPTLFFVCTMAVTLLIFSSGGTAGNHLLDLHAAAVLLFASWAVEAAISEFGVAAMAGACLVACLSLLSQHKEVDFVPVRQQLQEVVRAIGAAEKPILAEDPIVPIVAGQTPYLLDPFMFRVMREKEPSLGDPMWDMLQKKGFAAVVLMDDPDSDYGRDLYSSYHFGKGFIDRMRQNYAPADTPGEQYLYLPGQD